MIMKILTDLRLGKTIILGFPAEAAHTLAIVWQRTNHTKFVAQWLAWKHIYGQTMINAKL